MRLFTLFCLLSSSTLFSTEIDSFTLRDPYMRDALTELNTMTQGYFNQAIKNANKANSCKPEIFEEAFLSIIGGTFWSQIEKDIEVSETLDWRNIARKNSIYRDVSAAEGIFIHLGKLGFLLKVGDFHIGSDKFGHFFELGYEYFKQGSLDEALAYGDRTERTYFGLWSTSVYSYGDLAANFDGYRFWKQLARGENSYMMCKNNQWSQKRRFNWGEYANAAWDEGFNCSRYRNDHVTDSVNIEIKALGLTCPIKNSYCANMIERYGDIASSVISPVCFN